MCSEDHLRKRSPTRVRLEVLLTHLVSYDTPRLGSMLPTREGQIKRGNPALCLALALGISVFPYGLHQLIQLAHLLICFFENGDVSQTLL